MRIVQVAPTINAGSGVAGVAFHLEQEFRRLGVPTERFTLAEARAPRFWTPRGPFGARLATALRVAWFTTVGTSRAKRFLAARPDAVVICHNDALVGDIYVNHGILRAAMRARGHYSWRMLRNPLHLFTSLRDWIRYASHTHRVVVNLTEGERSLLRRMYPVLRPRAVVIPNGVDIERFAPATADQRRDARADFGLGEASTVAVFVGHEFDRKGLTITMEAIAEVPGVELLVVGGTPDMIRAATSTAESLGVAPRVHFMGTQPDPRPFLRSADVFVLASAYEANALVVLEALSCGLPVLATRVGFAPDIIVDGVNGYLIERTSADLAARLAQIATSGREGWRERARATAEELAWPAVARQYLALAEELWRDKASH